MLRHQTLNVKYYFSKVVQRWTMKQGGNPHDSILADRYVQA